jgi:signal transduction histidine kinase
MTELVDRLAAHATVGAAPREELAWLAVHGTVRHLAEGEILVATGREVEGMYIVLEGHLGAFADHGAGRRRIDDLRAGHVSGVLPYSRLVTALVDLVALAETTILVIRRDDLPAMILHCRELTSILVHVMLDRSRLFTSVGLHDEKMVSLGKLSAGLAHELNNPVSAIARNAALLEDRLDDVERATRALGVSKIAGSQLAAIDAIRSACTTGARGALSPIEHADREEAIAGWLAGRGVGTDVAGPLAETAVTLDVLNTLAGAVSGPQLEAVLRWAAAGSTLRGLASEIREAAMRISDLVNAIKGFTHMDRAAVAEPVDLASSLLNTVAVLNSKARMKSATVAVDVAPNLPRVRGFVGELNQIWANLIDNALDAVQESGRVQVTARPDRQRVVVRVIDNGTGIPPEVRAHIFDPFFTTKGIGHGMGLGLDIVRRLVGHNEGEIDVESQPGRTQFAVWLPASDTASATEMKDADRSTL